MPRAAAHRRRSILLAVVGLAFVALGITLAAWAVQTAMDAHALHADGVRATAQVRDMQISEQHTKRTTSREYQVRYSFRVRGDDTTYRAEDDIFFLQQDDVWVEVPRSTWDASRDSGTIAIEYRRSDPSVNQPLAARRGYGSAALFLALGLIALAIGVVLTRGALRTTVGTSDG